MRISLGSWAVWKTLLPSERPPAARKGRRPLTFYSGASTKSNALTSKILFTLLLLQVLHVGVI